MPLTMKELAKQAGVDISTVSRALADSPRVKPSQKERIKKLARELNYQPNAIAASLKHKKTMNIGILVPRLQYPGGETLGWHMDGIYQVLEAHNYNVTLSSVLNSGFLENRLIREQRVDGAIILGGVYTDADLKSLENLKLPFIISGQNPSASKRSLPMISFCDYESAVELTHQIVQKLQRKNLVFISGGETFVASNERLRGYQDACKTLGIEAKTISGDFTLEYKSGEKSAKTILGDSSLKKTNAVIAASDQLATGMYKFFHKNKIKIPEDIAIASFNNNAIYSLVEPELTSVDLHAHDLGEISARYLLDWIQKGKRPSIDKYQIGYHICSRGSCPL